MANLINKLKTNNTANNNKESDRKAVRIFGKQNFIMMAGCVVLIVVGFMLMSGGGTNDTSFNPEIFSTRRIVVGPLLSFLGFLLMAFAIIWTPNKSKK